jgi:hypothetical protein
MGLPWNRHVSFVVAFQRTYVANTPTPPTPEPTPPPEDPVDPPVAPATEIVDQIRNAAWNALYPSGGVNYNPRAAFAIFAREKLLGAPCTQERNHMDFRYQGYVNGIVCARRGQWQQIIIIPW